MYMYIILIYTYNPTITIIWSLVVAWSPTAQEPNLFFGF